MTRPPSDPNSAREKIATTVQDRKFGRNIRLWAIFLNHLQPISLISSASRICEKSPVIRKAKFRYSVLNVMGSHWSLVKKNSKFARPTNSLPKP